MTLSNRIDPIGLTDPFERCLALELVLTSFLGEFNAIPTFRERILNSMRSAPMPEDGQARKIVEAAIRFVESVGPKLQ